MAAAVFPVSSVLVREEKMRRGGGSSVRRVADEYSCPFNAATIFQATPARVDRSRGASRQSRVLAGRSFREVVSENVIFAIRARETFHDRAAVLGVSLPCRRSVQSTL